MKKKYYVFISIFILFLISLFVSTNKNNNEILENTVDNTKVKNNIPGMFAIMLETEAGSGVYKKSTASTWPGEGYIFNEQMSACENGSKLTWNEELGAVNLKTNISERCYVYFDRYILPLINNVTTSNIETDSITLTVSATIGTSNISTYYYSNNNGSSYVSSSNNTYTFSGLDMGTVYNFSVYVEDSAGYESEVYNLSETTDEEYYFIITSLNDTGTLFLNGEEITVEENTPVYYEIGDVLSYDFSVRYSDRGIILYDENNELIDKISFVTGSGGPIVLTGIERYIEEYTEGRPEPGIGGVVVM